MPTTVLNKECIIAFYNKKRNIPLTRADNIISFRKKHAAIRHEYYSLCEKHVNKDKYMFTFTAAGRGRGVYTKLRLINDIKSHVTYLIANSKSDIYFFSNIEIGSELSNPHLHTQIWSDDKNAVKEIYERTIKKFGLVKKKCTLSEPQQKKKFYNYVIKDYSKTLTDDEIWNVEKTKKRMRKTLGLQLRFYSKSKGKYTSKMYKMIYHAFHVLRAKADDFLDLVTSTLFFKKDILQNVLNTKKQLKSFSISSFITIKNKEFLDFDFLYNFFDSLGEFDILFFSPSLDPPFLLIIYDYCVFILFQRSFYDLYFIYLLSCVEKCLFS